ncbi:MAG: DUF4339 domain-containing protein [Bdellovibrionales bacterium]|nr:DUF4339 domain-containing protein [Bdellovibrionales bacterium]
MENTENVFLSSKGDQAIWFVAIDHEKWLGPLSASEIVARIAKSELTWAHYGWRKGQSKWMRLCDIEEFKAAVPAEPNKIIEVEVHRSAASAGAPPPVPKKPAQSWYLYYNDSQFGPFTEEDIHRFLRIGKIHGEVHIWKDGMAGWEKIKRLDSFKESVSEAKSARTTKRAEKRKSPRVPVVARGLMATGGKVFAAVCRDVSVGGMQVLTRDLPGPVGSRLKLNISAPVTAAGKKIESFVAEGEIVRLLEDGRGFSFRFDGLSDRSRSCIEAYIESNETRK